MDIPTLTSFFMWCTILNAGLLLYAAFFVMFAPDFTYRMQSKFVPISRDTWNSIVYSYLGGFKVLIIVFSLVPYLALLIIG